MEKYPEVKIGNEKYSIYGIELLKTGHDRATYLLTDKDGNKLIAKKGYASKDLGANTMNDVVYQTFAISEGLDFIPKIIDYDYNNDFYTEEFVGDNDVDFKQLTLEQIDTFALQLRQVHSLSSEQFNKFLTKNNLSSRTIRYPIDNIKIYGSDRFKIVKALCPDQYVVNWSSKNLEHNLRKVHETKPMASSSAHLIWGEIGNNLRQSGDKLFFIDWEFGRIGFGSELSYIKIHSHLNPNQFDHLIKRYAYHANCEVNELLEEIRSQESITRVNDVIWAAMKWGQAESIEDIEKYKKLTYERIKLSESID